MRILAFSILLLVVSLNINGQCIKNLGPDDFNQPSFDYGKNTDICVNGANEPYVIYEEIITVNSGKVIVRKFSGGKWTSVGDPIPVNITLEAKIRLATDGTPYIAFSSGLGIHVYKFDGIKWSQVGSTISNHNLNSQFDITLIANAPYIVVNDNTVTGVSVMKFDGANWIYHGGQGISTIASAVNSISADNSGIVYVAYKDAMGLIVKKYDGSNWVNVGSTIWYSGTLLTSLKLAMDPLGVPYLAIADPLGYLKKFDGSNWIAVGGGFTPSNAGSIDMVFDQFMNPIVSYEDALQNEKVTVKKFDGVAWTVVGNPSFSGKSSCGEMAIDSNFNLYHVCKDYGNMEKATVRKLMSGTWEILGDAGFSESISYWGSIATHKDGTTFVSYVDASINYGITVKKYNGANWINVGTPILNPSAIMENKIVLDQGGTPYLLYQDTSYNPVVKKFDGSSWINVGNPNVPNIGFISIAVNPVTGFPCIAFSDKTNSKKATVMQFNGSSWLNIGVPGFSNETVNDISIAFDSSGMPYVAFCADFSSSYFCVMKFNGSSWVYVDSPFFLGLPTTGKHKMQINQSGELFLAVKHSFDTNVLTHLPGGWSIIKSIPHGGFSTGFDFTLNKAGNPIIALEDVNEVDHKVSIIQYNGSTWSSPVKRGFSAGRVTYPLVSTDTLNNIYVAYSSDREYAKMITPGPAVVITSSADSICEGQSVQLTASNAVNYSWSIGSTNSTIMVSPTITTTYNVVGEVSNCISYASYNVAVSSCVGVFENSNQSVEPLLYPNPALDKIFVINEGERRCEKIEIYNLNGQKILTENLEEGTNKLDIHNLQEGFYIYKLIEKNNSVSRTGKIIVN